MPHHIVVPLHKSGGFKGTNLELRYVLRALERHFKDEFELTIVGPKLPKWLTGAKLIQTKKGLKFALKLAANAYPDGFFWWYDDVVPLRDGTAEDFKIPFGKPGLQNSGTDWSEGLVKIGKRLVAEGYDPVDFSHSHCMYWFDKGMVDEGFSDWPDMAGKFPWESWILSKRKWPYRRGGHTQYYGDFNGPPSVECWYMNFNGRGFTADLQKWLDSRFPNRSRFERSPNDEGLGLMFYDTTNLGDYVQMTAVKQLQGQHDFTLLRDKISLGSRAGKMIAAGWFMHKPENWPPHPDIEPLFIGFHANSDRLISQHIDYFKRHAPIGCRDMHTWRLCERHGVPAYFSGCVTLTLSKPDVPYSGEILFVDISPPEGVDFPALATQKIKRPDSTDAAEWLSQSRLEQLASAKCVVTNRLHVALPCAAFDVPCLLIDDGVKDAFRFEGLSDFVTFSRKRNDRVILDFMANPPPNPNREKRIALADSIRAKVAAFIGERTATPTRKLEILIRESGAEWKKAIDPFEGVPMDESRVRGDQSKFKALGDFVPMIPERGVAFIKGGGTIGRDGWVVTDDGRRIVDLSWFHSPSTTGFKKQPRPRVNHEEFRKGACLDLTSNWCFENYAHWLLESVGRLAVLDLAGLRFSDFDYVRLPKVAFKQSQTILEAIGFPFEKLVAPKKDHTLMRFETLAKPTIAGIPKQFHHSLPEFFRQRVQFNFLDAPERIYVRRSAPKRRMLNQTQVEEILKSRGFHIHDPSSEGLEFMSRAKVIIGCHQAGMADMMFAPPGAMVLELLPTDQQSQYYQSLARQSGHDYECLLSPSRVLRNRGYGFSSADFTVSIPELITFLDEKGL